MSVSQDMSMFLDNAGISLPSRVIYLASPYSDPNPTVMAKRAEDVSFFTALLIGAGYAVISPVSLTVPLAKHRIPKEGWYRYCLSLQKLCHELWVYKQEGWRESQGVRLELAFALGKGMPVQFVDKKYADRFVSNGDDIPF